MNVWLIAGGAYVAALVFALALCRVASPPSGDCRTPTACTTEPMVPHNGHEQPQEVSRGMLQESARVPG